MLLGQRVLFYCFLVLATIKFSFGLTSAAPLDFANSKWIWTADGISGLAPPGSRAFRKSFSAPEGKKPASADILITADDQYTLYVNGGLTGTGILGATQRFCVPLSRSCLNIFAVNATNAGVSPNPAGVLATIRITYTDGTTSTIVTDTKWHAATTVATGFEKLTLDDSSWSAAIITPLSTAGVAVPPDPSTLSLSSSSWIWTNEVAGGIAPAGARAFRKTFTLPTGQLATSADILITADNQYSLYVNGRFIGTGTDFASAQRFTVDLQRASDVLFAVYAANTLTVPNPAGLIVAIVINTASNCYCKASSLVTSDSTWKSNTGVPAGFHLPGFDDSKWPGVTIQGTLGTAPWGAVSVSAGVSPPGSPLPGAPVGT